MRRRITDLRNRFLLWLRSKLEESGHLGAQARTRKASMSYKVIRRDGTSEKTRKAHTAA